jgi:hypothetical protein
MVESGGVVSERAGLAVGRRRLAERVAVELACYRHGRHGTGSDFLAATAVQVRLESAPWMGVRMILTRAASAAQDGSAEVWSVSGPRGLVFFIHGSDWSVVFPFLPFTGLMLVCVDDLEDNCLELLDDQPRARQAAHEVFMAATAALAEGRVHSLPDVPPGEPAPATPPRQGTRRPARRGGGRGGGR